MEERKTFFDYAGHIFSVFGLIMVIMMVLCRIFGEDAKEISSMFQLGSRGLALETMLQYLGVAVFMELIRILFFTDLVIRKLSLTLRTVGMLMITLLLIAVFIIVFDWFAADSWGAWGMFALCFGISVGVSAVIAALKEKIENRQMAEGLDRLKKQWQNEEKKEEKDEDK